MKGARPGLNWTGNEADSAVSSWTDSEDEERKGLTRKKDAPKIKREDLTKRKLAKEEERIVTEAATAPRGKWRENTVGVRARTRPRAQGITTTKKLAVHRRCSLSLECKFCPTCHWGSF